MGRSNKRLKSLEHAMAAAQSYDQWRTLATEHDDLSGMSEWRDVEQTDLYDYAQIRLRLDRLKSLRARNDYQGLLFALNEGIHGNMGGMGKSVLYRMAKFGTKRLIEDYIAEIDSSLRVIAELDDDIISAQKKWEFFYRCNVCFGRSALMLSGGGMLGFLHLGVINVLVEQQLLPRVISGSSAGALVAGVLACHSDKELGHFRDPVMMRAEAAEDVGFFRRLILGSGPRLSLEDLEQLIERFVPNMTFEEAYAKTGRQVSITVAPSEPHQRSRLLNAVTSPNVYIRAAVRASCAVPGVFPPVMLMAKNVRGEPQPYLPGRRWVDGSVADELPAKRLSRLFSTNHYIVSMVNPIATAFIANEEEKNVVKRSISGLTLGVGREMLNFYRGIAQKRGANWPRFNMALHGLHALVDQEYTGDINIVPSFRLANPLRLLSHLDESELLAIVQHGEKACFSKIEAIRSCTMISRTLEDILYRFESGAMKPDSTKINRPRSSQRRPAPANTQSGSVKKRSTDKRPVQKATKRSKTSRPATVLTH